MSGRVLVRIPAVRKKQAPDAVLVRPWFHRSAGDATVPSAPSLVSFHDTKFVEDYLAGVEKSESAWTPGAFPKLVPFRDWCEPPAAMTDDTGAALYPTAGLDRPLLPGEADEDADFDPTPADAPPWVRKLYLPLHTRFTIATIEVLCDELGQPRVDPARVAEVGFVLRRLRRDRTAEVWEDWLPAPDGGGVWAPLAVPIDLVDPARVRPMDVIPARAAAVAAQLGVSAGTEVGLATTPMVPVPKTIPSAATHTAYWAYVPVHSSDLQKAEATPSDGAKALADAARQTLTDLVGGRATELGTTLRGPWQALVADLLPAAPTDTQVNNAINSLVASNPGALTAAMVQPLTQEHSVAAWIGDALRTSAFERAQGPAPETASWTAPTDGVVDLVASRVGGDLAAAMRARRTDARTLLRRAIADLVDDVADPTAWSSASRRDRLQALVAGILGDVRAHRIVIKEGLMEVFGGDIEQLTARTIADPYAPLTRVPAVTVGSLSGEITALLETPPDTLIPWATPTVPALSRRIHGAAATWERAVSELVRRGGDAGGGFAREIDRRVRVLRTSTWGSTLRAEGLDVHAQPELGLLVFPTLIPSQGDLDTLVTTVADAYDPPGSPPIATQVELKARSTVVQPRLDPDHLYCLVAYARVRGHDPCAEERLLWSPRTEVFCLADPLDILGMKPTPMRLPDIPKLLRDLPRIPKAGAAPVAPVFTPPNSGFVVGEEPQDTAREWGIAWICSFGIPVFTICAWIVFSIILNILLLIPGFGWLLLLKFCIPVPVPKE